jgi:curli production assembly/transport component CsgE
MIVKKHTQNRILTITCATVSAGLFVSCQTAERNSVSVSDTQVSGGVRVAAVSDRAENSDQKVTFATARQETQMGSSDHTRPQPYRQDSDMIEEKTRQLAEALAKALNLSDEPGDLDKGTMEREIEDPSSTSMEEIEIEVIEEITGLIVEDTMTRIGREFYEYFHVLWEEPEGLSDYNIYITERADARWGSLIQVEINVNMTNTPVWAKVLRPRSAEVEEAAEEAVQVTYDAILNYEQMRQALEGDDMLGDGIM